MLAQSSARNKSLPPWRPLCTRHRHNTARTAPAVGALPMRTWAWRTHSVATAAPLVAALAVAVAAVGP
eukprot:6667155-Prymnesium_polylepis.2